ncbi:MAG: 5'/3'-nucleotidase SurE, partial [Candidatus Kapaibacterium sp.]
LNVNVPAIPTKQMHGVAFTKQGASFWEDEFEKRVDPQERPYYWLKGRYILEDKDSDIDDIAIRERKISITPIHYDLTNYEFLETLRTDWPKKF